MLGPLALSHEQAEERGKLAPVFGYSRIGALAQVSVFYSGSRPVPETIERRAVGEWRGVWDEFRNWLRLGLEAVREP